MKRLLSRADRTRFTCLAVSAAGCLALHAETSAEHLLKVYRETYAQLLELGIQPAEAATEARKVAKDDTEWMRRQHAQGASAPEGGAGEGVGPAPTKPATNATVTVVTETTQKNSPFTDERRGSAIALTPATARPVIQKAAAELLALAKGGGTGSNSSTKPTFDRLFELVQTNRLGSAGAGLLKSFDRLTNSLSQLADLKAGGFTNETKAMAKEKEVAEEMNKAGSNRDRLTNLQSELAALKAVGITNQAKTTAKAMEVAQETDKAAGNLEVLLSTNKFTPKAFLHIGYVTLNPYNFVPKNVGTTTNHFQLDDGSTSAAYVEFQYNNRWAWNWLEPGPAELRQLNWVNPFSRQSDLDLQARFGYSFVSAETNQVSSIVGGGNINGEFTVGAPFLKYQNDWVRYSIDLEATYGMAADRSDFDIHSTYLFGAGYHASIDSDFFPGRVLMSLHLGVGSAEVPDVYDKRDGLVSVELGRAKFWDKLGVFGMAFETLLPLNASTYVVAGGRLYANADPNPWSAYIGISKELGSLRKIFSDDPVTGEKK
jgi:hypothetical protein